MTPEQISKIRQQYGIQDASAPTNNATTVAQMRNAWAEADAKKAEAKPKGNLFSDIGQDIGQTFGNIAGRAKDVFSGQKDIQQRQQTGETNIASGFLQSMGNVAGGASGAFGDVISGIVKAGLSPDQEQKVKGFVENVGTKVVELPPVQSGVEAYQRLQQENPELARNLESVFNIGMLAADVFGSKTAMKGLQMGTKGLTTGAKQVGTTAGKVAGQATDLTQKATINIMKQVKPMPTPIKAVGEVLQGGVKDIKQGVKGLAQLDTAGVKTFKDLGTKITGRIGELAQQVDADLALDTVKTKLKDLAISAKTTGGKIVKSNPVETALNQLDELYTKIGDVVGSANIKELIDVAKKQGLTKLEINDIARTYGQEFGEKAFNKMGDALTSVNAQMYENTRKALKTLARSGISGDTAKLADEAMSSLYNTQRLVKKNIEAVNKIQQKIAERGLLEKIGNTVSKYGDILTGGTIRGLVGGLLPRGAGYKVMNALDIEQVLERNLKIIQDAIKGGSDADIIKILNKLDSPKANPAVGQTVKKLAEPADDFVYHTTNIRNMDSIKKEGLKLGRYNDLSFSPTEEGASWYGGIEQAKLRVKKSAIGKYYEGVAPGQKLPEIQSYKAIKPKDLEIYKNGKWQPLIKESSLSSSIKQAKASGQSFDEWVKRQGETLYHGGENLKEVGNMRSKWGAFYMTENPTYAKSYGGKNSTLNEMLLSKNAKIADLRKPDNNLIKQIEDIISPKETGKSITITKPDGTKLTIPEKKGGISNPVHSSKDIIQGIKDGKAYYAEMPEVKEALKKLGYDGMITQESKFGANYGVWNKNVIKTLSQLKAEWDGVK